MYYTVCIAIIISTGFISMQFSSFHVENMDTVTAAFSIRVFLNSEDAVVERTTFVHKSSALVALSSES